MATSMGMKLNTKAWVDNSKPYDSSPNEAAVSTLTPDQKEKIGAEDLSAVLNKAADKDWVDTSKRVAGHGNANMDKDAFFKLMLAQLKNQDPMNPLKNHEMAAQLAQFSALEQMTNMNITLNKIEGQNTKPQDFQALNLIGKTVVGDSSRVVRTKFDKKHDFNFDLAQDASEVNVKLMNTKGEIMQEYKLTHLKSGNNKVTWNGKNKDGIDQAEGEYFFQVEAKNNQMQKIPIKTEFQGAITGMSFSAEGPVLQIGNQTIKLKDVRQISDPSIKSNDQNNKNSSALDLKKAEQVGETENTKEPKASAAVPQQTTSGNVMTDVAMSRELYNQLQKEMK